MSNLIEYRRAVGISQREFALSVGVDPSVISKIEAGVTRPGLDLAARIEAATGGAVTAISFASHRIAPVSAPDARGSCQSTENHSVSEQETVEFHTGGSPDAI